MGRWETDQLSWNVCPDALKRTIVAARFPNGTMITGVFENHGATGEAGDIDEWRYISTARIAIAFLDSIPGHEEVGQRFCVHRPWFLAV